MHVRVRVCVCGERGVSYVCKQDMSGTFGCEKEEKAYDRQHRE